MKGPDRRKPINISRRDLLQRGIPHIPRIVAVIAPLIGAGGIRGLPRQADGESAANKNH
jgi:hypothetical protein